MLLQPKSLKFKKVKKGRISRLELKSNKLKFGNIGLKCIESGTITARQLESSRQAITRKINRKGKLWLRIYPSIPVTSKPSEVRMGKGKGSVNHWVSRVKAGQVLFEVCGIDLHLATLAFGTGKAKLPLKTTVFK